MLFLGNQKYGAAGELDKYLSRHAGDSNAFTEMHFSCFHFDVDADGLEGALDRFANLFISPKLDPAAMEREVRPL